MHPTFIRTGVETAVGVVLASISLWLPSLDQIGDVSRAVASVCGAAIGLGGVITMILRAGSNSKKASS